MSPNASSKYNAPAYSLYRCRPNRLDFARVGYPQDLKDELDAFTAQKGEASGLAELDENGKVPSSQLPSYVDDVEEYTTRDAFPETGESGKIYVDVTANLSYRWSGTTYVPVATDLALGETSSTAFPGDKGKEVYDKVTAMKTKTFKFTYDDGSTETMEVYVK